MALSESALPPRAPRSEFQHAGAHDYDRRGPVRWIISHLLRYPVFALGFVVATLLVSVLRSTVPRLTGQAFDLVSTTLAGGTATADAIAAAGPGLLRLALLLLAIILVQGLLELGSSFAVETMGQRLERDARDELYLSLLGKSQTFHNRQRVGDIMARATNDVRQLNPMMNPGVSLILDSLLSLVIPIIAIAFIDMRLLAAPLAFTFLFYFALRRYTRKLNPVTGRQRMLFGRMNAGLAETISGIEVVKAAAQEPAEKDKFERAARNFRDAFVEQGQIQARYLPLLILAAALAGAFLHGVILVDRGDITIGELIAYVGLMGILRFPAFISIFTFTLVQLGIAGTERILELISAESELDENAAGFESKIQGEITFDNVSFGYTEGKPVIDGITFRAAPGETIAIVGQAGSGKTTMTKLVSRIYDTTQGRVLVDGVDVRDWSLQSLRSQISVIEQDVFLFSRSIRENIAFGRGRGQDIDDAAVERAAREAQAHDFITALPDGYDTVIGERGATLSGGQRQRLAIARALLTDPRILVLDDSTSAIDSATEDKIQSAIRRVLEGRTTLLITHRLSQIRWADRILILDGGRLADHGSHEELLARSPLYKRIFGRRDGADDSANGQGVSHDQGAG
jgi:ATP-binding cassette subfamily B protein